MLATKSSKTGGNSDTANNNRKTSLSVVGANQAVEGYIFFYTGPLSECKSCKVKNICFGLTPNRMYEIKEVRDRTHECTIFESGVRVVKVEEIPMEYVMDSKKAVEGSVISLEDVSCGNLGCDHYKICGPQPIGLKKGDKFKIVEINGDAKCSKGSKKVKTMIFPA